jgi:hypothetical protein
MAKSIKLGPARQPVEWKFAGVLLFSKAPDNVRRAWSEFLTYRPNDNPVDFEFVERDSGRVALHIAQNISLDDAFEADMQSINRLRGRMWPGRLIPHLADATSFEDHPRSGNLPLNADTIASLGPIGIHGSSTAAVNHIQLHWGPNAPSAPDLTKQATLEPTAPACLATMNSATLEMFQSMRNISPHQALLDAPNLLADYDSAAEACADDLPEGSDDANFAKGRVRLLLAQLQGNFPPKDEVETRCDEGDEYACGQLERTPEGRYENLRDARTKLIDTACELAGSTACHAAERLAESGAIPVVGAP